MYHRRAFDYRPYPVNYHEWGILGVFSLLMALLFKTP